MTVLLFDTYRSRQKMYPLALARPICDIRYGMFTQREWIGNKGTGKVFSLTEDYLKQEKPDTGGPFLCIDSAVCLTEDLWERVLTLQEGESLEDEKGLLAYVSKSMPGFNEFPLFFTKTFKSEDVERLHHPMNLVLQNAGQILAHSSTLDPVKFDHFDSSSNKKAGDYPVYVAEGTSMTGCFINTENGPVIIEKNALVMEGACIRGPVFIGEGAVVKMGAQIYGGTTIGRFCTAGGEIKNSILGDFSNKAHHGYLGDSIIGQWCNLGAGTTNSNVKNNAGTVKMWDGETRSFVPFGRKAGMVLGDFSRTSIQSIINTGTTIGLSCNILQGEIPPKHLPSFSWGLSEKYEPQKACRDIAAWMNFKNRQPDQELESVILFLSNHGNEKLYDENHG